MNITFPKISIVVPVYNVEAYVSKCIESIMHQDYENIEIIVVDDGSTDTSSKICEQYARSDNRIRLIHQENQGLSMARNNGIDIAAGEYIGFVDSDDWIKPDMYSTLYNNAAEHDADISIGNFNYVMPSGEHIPFANENTGVKVFEGIYKVAHNIRTTNNFAWNKLYRKSLFDNIRFPKGKTFEDIFTMYKLIDAANKIVVSAESKYYYVRRDSSITMSPFNISHLDNTEAYIERYRYISSKYPQLESTCRKQIFTSAIWVMSKLYWTSDKELFNKVSAHIKNMIHEYDYKNCGLSLEYKNRLETYFSIGEKEDDK